MEEIFILSLQAMMLYKCVKNYVKESWILMKIEDKV